MREGGPENQGIFSYPVSTIQSITAGWRISTRFPPLSGPSGLVSWERGALGLFLRLYAGCPICWCCNI